MAATTEDFQKRWGEVLEPLPKAPALHIEITEPKPADYELPTLHQPSSEHFPPKDELPAKFMASVKPPVDKHSQNLTLHCIELQHHKRRMRLMLMAAQHQYGEAGRSDGAETTSLPAHPPRPKRFCSSQGIITPPTQSTILSRAKEFVSPPGTHSTLACAELDSASNRHLLMRAVASLCALAGFDMASESALEILTDILDDFNTKLCHLLRTAVDNEALNGRSGFSDAMEYALHEIGLGGCAAIQKYWTQGVQDYAVRLDQEDMEMIQDYKSFLDPATKSSPAGADLGVYNSLCLWSADTPVLAARDIYLFQQKIRIVFSKPVESIKEDVNVKGSGVLYKTSVGTDTSEQSSEFSNLSPYGIVSNGPNTGEGNSDPTSPNWGMSYIKAEGEEDESYDDPMNVVPKTPQSS